ncbi:MAG: hypothetical protein AB8F94_11850 [Saprospiraceae bacterium]
MSKSHFDEILDYGLFQTEESFNISDLPSDIDWSKYKYFTKVKTADNSIITFRSKSSSLRPIIGDIGFNNNDRIQDGYFSLANGGWVLHIENGFLKNWLRMIAFRDPRKKVDLEVETIFPFGIQKGNRVFIDKNPALDGEYFTSRFGTLNVNDSKIIDEVDSETIVFRPSKSYQFFWSLFGLAMATASSYTLINIFQDQVSKNDISAFTIIIFIAILFLGMGIATIFNVLFYRFRVDENSLSIGSFLNHKTVLDKDVEGVFFLVKGTKNGKYKLPIIVKKDGTQVRIDPHRVMVAMNKIEPELLKKYYLFTPEEAAAAELAYDDIEKERSKGCLVILVSIGFLIGFIYFVMYASLS